MLVTSVEIEAFRHITNKQTMAVDPEVMCLIGKNESGKTTILKALHRLNPANNADDFHVTTDYPRRHLSRDRRSKNLDRVAPVTAIFALEAQSAPPAPTIRPSLSRRSPLPVHGAICTRRSPGGRPRPAPRPWPPALPPRRRAGRSPTRTGRPPT
ncbi:AAA family ATPase [Streptomyces sp. enrichment culture]|uniref:AAA family ATPase n=1 Tax=Streptomyces sp. enrichment culture TaxID=1795815 RepID=UPI003F54F326